MNHTDLILKIEYIKYSILERLIYLPEVTKEEREEYLLKIVEIERKMEEMENSLYK